MLEVSARSLQRLDNEACVYCNRVFGPDLSRTDEHTIGTKFVPKGSMAAQWNLILGACRECNAKKGVLESELSALTIRPDPWGRIVNAESSLSSTPFLALHSRQAPKIRFH